MIFNSLDVYSWHHLNSHLQAQLGGLNGSHIATRSGSDDYQIDLLTVRVVAAAESRGQGRSCPEGTNLSLQSRRCIRALELRPRIRRQLLSYHHPDTVTRVDSDLRLHNKNRFRG